MRISVICDTRVAETSFIPGMILVELRWLARLYAGLLDPLLCFFWQGFDEEKFKKIVKIKEERGARVGR